MKHLALASLLLAPAAFAQTAVTEDLALTVYNSNLALVADERSVTLGAGDQVIELPGVSSAIMPATVTFDMDAVTILEQNFDFDLLSPTKLMEKHVGEFVQIVRTNPGNGNVERERAKVLSVNNGVIVQIDDRIEVLRDDDIPTRVVFAEVPDNLRARPTLSIRVDSDRAGTRPAELSYLTSGLQWKADYVASFDDRAQTIDLQGWATINNTTQTTFEDAELTVIAGDVATAGAYNRNRYDRPRFVPGTGGSDEERIGSNYLYPLADSVTVRANQTKQIGIVDVTGVPGAQRYSFDSSGFYSDDTPVGATSELEFVNTGVALPAGILRVYQTDSAGRSQFVGEDRITHTPSESTLRIATGKAFDVRVQSEVVEQDERSSDVSDTTMLYRFTNATSAPVTVEFTQRLSNPSGVEYTLRDTTQPPRQQSNTAYVWDVAVPANGRTDLRFTIRARDE